MSKFLRKKHIKIYINYMEIYHKKTKVSRTVPQKTWLWMTDKDQYIILDATPDAMKVTEVIPKVVPSAFIGFSITLPPEAPMEPLVVDDIPLELVTSDTAEQLAPEGIPLELVIEEAPQAASSEEIGSTESNKKKEKLDDYNGEV